MRYSLDAMCWQEFEVLAFKALQLEVAPEVQYLEGGNDKGRDIIHVGDSLNFMKGNSGKWLFQAKHKSKELSDATLRKILCSDLEKELIKVFKKNKLIYENYVLITNKTITANTFDALEETFNEFVRTNEIECKFNIYSYRHFESIIDSNESLQWSFPNIVSKVQFNSLLKKILHGEIEARTKAWLRGIDKQREKFVYTLFFQKAKDKLDEYPVIILSGPPKSGKTFNAEILVLNYVQHQSYYPIVIDKIDEVEKFFDENKKQIFLFDDSFGKHTLNYDVENIQRKLEKLFYLADREHLFIFTSREYIFRAFSNQGNHSIAAQLEKIIVESHTYLLEEKRSILFRYTENSGLLPVDKISILDSEDRLIEHKNFSPETIRAFFSNFNPELNHSQLKAFKDHLEFPDAYLRDIFFNLAPEKQAVILSVLCTNDIDDIAVYNSFKQICIDLGLNSILNTRVEFDELDDSILRIAKSEEFKRIQFYHPSMEEFLVRGLIEDESPKLKQVVLMNLNLDLLRLSLIIPPKNSIFKGEEKDKIVLKRDDLEWIEIGLTRYIRDSKMSLYHKRSLFEWLKLRNHTLDLKVNGRALFDLLKNVLVEMSSVVSSKHFYLSHVEEDCSVWSEFLFIWKSTSDIYGIKISNAPFDYFTELLSKKKDDPNYWMLVFRLLAITDNNFILDAVGSDWLNSFYTRMKKEIYSLGEELFGSDFPEFEEYNKNKAKGNVQKRKNDPSKDWYPRFVRIEEYYNVLKEVKGKDIGNRLISKLSVPYTEIRLVSEYAKNRYSFNVKQGWWKEPANA